MPTVRILSQLLAHGEQALCVSCHSGTLIGLLQQGFLTSESLMDVVSPDLMMCDHLRRSFILAAAYLMCQLIPN